MTDFTQPLLDLLNDLVPLGSQHATEYYTLNEFFVYLLFMSIVVFFVVLIFRLIIGLAFKVGK